MFSVQRTFITTRSASALYHQSNVNFSHGGLKGFIITQTLLLIYKGNSSVKTKCLLSRKLFAKS